MAKLNYLTTIAIDTDRSVIHFYSMTGNDKDSIVHQIKSYKSAHFSAEFFEIFKQAVKEFSAETPSDGIRKITVVLPDSAVLLDTIKVPTMKGATQTRKTLSVTLGNLYKNYSDLRLLAYVANQNKQYSTFAVTAVQRKIVSAIYSACAENKLFVETLTFASCATISGALAVHSKYKNDSYLFLDVKENSSNFIFVADGVTTGFYSLPFGLDLLNSQRVIQEDMLFDHSFAELFVLNAKERAKSKKLTVALEEQVSDDYEEDEDYEPDEDGALDGDAVQTYHLKNHSKKAPRKLPKFMQRETPETLEGVAYENFRIFVKWALNLIKENERLVELSEPEFVCVNIPKNLEFVIDKANESYEENGIKFIRLPSDEEDGEIIKNLDLYGGLISKYVNPYGRF